MTDTLRVYVACLAAYNGGRLHGEWIDIESGDDAEDIQRRIDAMLARSPEALAEEWAIHDWEAPIALGLGEHEALDDLVAFADLIADSDPGTLGAAADVWCRSEGIDALAGWVERCRGAYETKGEYAEEMCGDCAEIPSFLRSYIDWPALERDMEMGGDIVTTRHAGRIYVFDATA